MTAFVLIACLVIGCAGGSQHKPEAGSDEALLLCWRDKRVTVAEIESGQDSPKKDPGWQRFQGVLKPGDELWHFRSPGPTWKNLAGWEGCAAFREGGLVETYTTREN